MTDNWTREIPPAPVPPPVEPPTPPLTVREVAVPPPLPATPATKEDWYIEGIMFTCLLGLVALIIKLHRKLKDMVKK